MSRIWADRVLETTTTTGTGTLTLAGAVSGYQSFAAVGNGNTCYACIYDVDSVGNPNGSWEVFSGTYTSSGTTLSRTSVLASSNSGSAVSFGSGTKRVLLTPPAGRSLVSAALPTATRVLYATTDGVVTDSSNLTFDGTTLTAGGLAGPGSSITSLNASNLSSGTVNNARLDATLTAFAALTIAADSLTIGTGTDAFTQTTFAANTFPAKSSSGNLVAKTISDFGLTLVADADSAAGRTSLGASTVGSNIFTLTNPSAIAFLRLNADNSVSALSAANFNTALGLGTGSSPTFAGATLTGAETITVTDATTTAVTTALTLDHETSGTAGNGIGVGLVMKAPTSTTANSTIASITAAWSTGTHASRIPDWQLTLTDNSTTITACEFKTDGSGVGKAGFLGATPVVRQTGDAGTALVMFGFMTGTPTFAAANLTGTSIPSGLVAAQSDQETATSTVLAVTPGRQQYHPSAAKGWIIFDGTATPPTILASYNVSSITDNGAGDWTINWTTAFSSANYSVQVTSNFVGGTVFAGLYGGGTSLTTGGARINVVNGSGTAVDRSNVCVAAWGDQ